MPRFRRWVIWCMGLVGWLSRGAPALAQTLPTDALHAFHVALREHPEQQGAIAEQFLATVRRDHLDRRERLALGELYFVSFDAEGAEKIFQEFVADDGVMGRMAIQRLLRLRMAAYDNYGPGIDSLMQTFYARFAPAPDDVGYNYAGVATLGDRLVEQGQHERVVALVMREVARLRFDAPYRSHWLPARFLASFEAVGRAPEALALVTTARDSLRALARKLESTGVAPRMPADPPPHRPGVIHRIELGLVDDLPRDQMFVLLASNLVARMDSVLAAPGADRR